MADLVLTDPVEIARTLPGLLLRDKFLSANFPGPADVLLTRDTAVAYCVQSRGRGALVARGDYGQILGLLTTHRALIGAVQVAFLPNGIESAHPGAIPEVLGLAAGGAWVWLSCHTALPPQPGEDRVVVLEDSARGEVADLLARANPIATASPEDERLEWWGYRAADGELLSVCAVEKPTPTQGEGAGSGEGSPSQRGVHLASFGTLPAARGQGIGSALLGSITRWGTARHGFVHFGVWVDNQDALRLYRRLGFQAGAEVQMYR